MRVETPLKTTTGTPGIIASPFFAKSDFFCLYRFRNNTRLRRPAAMSTLRLAKIPYSPDSDANLNQMKYKTVTG